jgi:hypothetical protein
VSQRTSGPVNQWIGEPVRLSTFCSSISLLWDTSRKSILVKHSNAWSNYFARSYHSPFFSNPSSWANESLDFEWDKDRPIAGFDVGRVDKSERVGLYLLEFPKEATSHNYRIYGLPIDWLPPLYSKQKSQKERKTRKAEIGYRNPKMQSDRPESCQR